MNQKKRKKFVQQNFSQKDNARFFSREEANAETSIEDIECQEKKFIRNSSGNSHSINYYYSLIIRAIQSPIPALSS